MSDIWRAIAEGLKEGATEGLEKLVWKGILSILIFGQLILFCWLAKTVWPDAPNEKQLIASLLAGTLGLLEIELICRAWTGKPFIIDPNDRTLTAYLLVGLGIAWALALFLFFNALH